MDVEAKAIDRLEKELPNLPARDVSTAARNLAVQAGVHQDKAATLRGQNPAPVNINLNVNELVRSMVAKGTPFYDSDGNPLTAEQVLAHTTRNPRPSLPPLPRPPRSPMSTGEAHVARRCHAWLCGDKHPSVARPRKHFSPVLITTGD
jgi:hypothetical protein